MRVTNDIRDNVRVALYNKAKIDEACDCIPDIVPGLSRTEVDWEKASAGTRIRALNEVIPDHAFSNHNVITQPYREHLRDLANPETTEESVSFEYMAFGEDDTEPSPSDEHLNEEVYRDEIDDHVSESDDEVYKATLLIGSDEAVGLDLIEAALVTHEDEEDGDDMAANRVILEDEEERLQPKDSDHAVTVRIELSYKDASEVEE